MYTNKLLRIVIPCYFIPRRLLFDISYSSCACIHVGYEVSYSRRGSSFLREREMGSEWTKSKTIFGSHLDRHEEFRVRGVRYLRGFEVGLVSVRGRVRREWAPRARPVCAPGFLIQWSPAHSKAPTVVEESSVLLSQDRSCPPRICIVRQARINDQPINYFDEDFSEKFNLGVHRSICIIKI